MLDRLAASPVSEPVVIELQRHESSDGGFTDIEIRAADVHVIVEAKRGWALPAEDQLRRYEAPKRLDQRQPRPGATYLRIDSMAWAL
jgi:hypothetical protein